jgi:hypothetical protein
MLDLDSFIVAVYLVVCDCYRQLFPHGIRERGFTPEWTDEEALTLGIGGDFLGLETDKSIYRHFRRHYQKWFPGLQDRTLLVRQWANLWVVEQRIWQVILGQAGALTDPHQAIDTLPVPICAQKRAARRRIFRDDLLLEPDYGCCEAKDWHYFGFKGALRLSWQGFIVQAGLVSARPHDSQDLDVLLAEVPAGTTIHADKAFVDRDRQEELEQEKGVFLRTPRKKNMAPSRFDLGPVGQRFRRLLETVGSQLTEHFPVQKMKARTGWTLVAKWLRKILAHTIGVWLNLLHGRDPLDFEGLVTV